MSQHVCRYLCMCVHGEATDNLECHSLEASHLVLGDRVSHWPRTQQLDQTDEPVTLGDPLAFASQCF